MISDLPAELDLNVESAMRHCMAVAHIANQNHRDLLVKNAQKVRTNEKKQRLCAALVPDKELQRFYFS